MNIKEYREKWWDNYHWNSSSAEALAVDYARYHVKRAVRALTRAQYDRASVQVVDELTKKALENFYPLKNIK